MIHVPIKHVPISSLQLVYIILQVSPLMFIPLQCIHLNSKSIHTTMKSFQSENSGFIQFLHLTSPQTCVKESYVQFKMKPLWRGRKKRAGQGREGQGKFRVAMGFIRNHPIHTLERHVSVSANLLSLISGISHIPSKGLLQLQKVFLQL